MVNRRQYIRLNTADSGLFCVKNRHEGAKNEQKRRVFLPLRQLASERNRLIQSRLLRIVLPYWPSIGGEGGRGGRKRAHPGRNKPSANLTFQSEGAVSFRGQGTINSCFAMDGEMAGKRDWTRAAHISILRLCPLIVRK